MKKFLLIIFGILLLAVISIAVWPTASVYLGSYSEETALSEGTVRLEVSQEQIQNIKSLKPGQVIFGKVEAKSENSFELTTQLTNPMDQSDVRTIPVSVTVEAHDEIVKFEQGVGSNLETVKASFEEIKIGDYLTITVLPDRKIIGLPMPSPSYD